MHLQEKKSSFKNLNFFTVIFRSFSLNSLLVILLIGILSVSMLSSTIHPVFAEENKANKVNIISQIQSFRMQQLDSKNLTKMYRLFSY